MKRKGNVRILTLRLTVMAAFIVVAAGTLPALASPQQALTFTVEEQFALDSGVFSSDGSIVCTSGTTTNGFRKRIPKRTRDHIPRSQDDHV